MVNKRVLKKPNPPFIILKFYMQLSFCVSEIHDLELQQERKKKFQGITLCEALLNLVCIISFPFVLHLAFMNPRFHINLKILITYFVTNIGISMICRTVIMFYQIGIIPIYG